MAGFDNLSSTIVAAETVGFEIVAWATIESCADEAHRRRLRILRMSLVFIKFCIRELIFLDWKDEGDAKNRAHAAFAEKRC